MLRLSPFDRWQRTAGNRRVAVMLLPELARAVADGSRRRRLVRHLWIEFKRYAAPSVLPADLSQVSGVTDTMIEGAVWRHDPLVLCAVARALDCQTAFEFGTYLGETAWLLAHNLPGAHVHTLDLPGPEALAGLRFTPTDPEYFGDWTRAERFLGTPEESRITRLFGDSATFDFSPYRGRMDLVFIDASHSYDYVRSDSEAALDMLSAKGAIVWDDYTYYAGVYRYVNELSARLDQPVRHILGTRLAIYSRRPVLSEEPVPDFRRNWP